MAERLSAKALQMRAEVVTKSSCSSKLNMAEAIVDRHKLLGVTDPLDPPTHGFSCPMSMCM